MLIYFDYFNSTPLLRIDVKASVHYHPS